MAKRVSKIFQTVNSPTQFNSDSTFTLPGVAAVAKLRAVLPGLLLLRQRHFAKLEPGNCALGCSGSGRGWKGIGRIGADVGIHKLSNCG